MAEAAAVMLMGGVKDGDKGSRGMGWGGDDVTDEAQERRGDGWDVGGGLFGKKER